MDSSKSGREQPRPKTQGDVNGSAQLIGAPIKGVQDRPLLTGHGIYVSDLDLAGQLYMTVVRSVEPHGRLKRVDVADALEISGVVDAFSAAMISEYLDPIPLRINEEGVDAFLQPPLAIDRVRYVGEPVAVVVAESKAVAEDAAGAVRVSIDPLPAYHSVDSAQEGALGLFDCQPSNLAKQYFIENGDVEGALRRADLSIEERFSIGRHGAVPIETRGLLASWDPVRVSLQVWGMTKVPHFNRMVLAHLLRIRESQIHLVETKVGGGFGARGEFYPEDLLAPLASIRIGRPIRWVESRMEHMMSANQSREQEWHVQLGVTKLGEIVGLKARVTADMGAYIRTHGCIVPRLSGEHLTGPYIVPAYQCEIHCVMTNKTPTGTYRSPGTFEATFVRERLLDIAAARLGIDPIHLRMRNFIRPDQMPYYTGVDLAPEGRVIYDSGDYSETLRVALEKSNYYEVKKAAGEDSCRATTRTGMGFAAFVEKTGTGPPETVRLSVDGLGKICVMTGSPSLGQGHETIFAQIVAELLNVPVGRVSVDPLETDVLSSGGGTWASRGATLAASAVYLSAMSLREQVKSRVSELWDVAPGTLRLDEGQIVHAESGRAIAVLEAAALLARSDGGNSTFTVQSTFRPEREPYSYGTLCATVDVDTETGNVTVRRCVLAVDLGKVINPSIVVGQSHGAIVQGIGGALFEEFVYGDKLQPLATTFADYLIPSVAEIPDIDVVMLENYPSPLTPLGSKGAGEIGIVGVGAAVANAVADALGLAGQDAFLELPVTPQRVLSILRKLQ